jgi:serine/threonine-protein kinase
MDFGIATLPSAAHTHSGTVLGSPKYMAPEQVRGQRSDGRADVYALGAVLYELLTGSAPFEAESVATVLYRVINVPPVDASRLDPRISPAVDAILSRALAKNPDARYATADEFARELRAIAADADIPVAAVGVTPRAGASSDDPTLVLDAVGTTGSAATQVSDTADSTASGASRRPRRWLVWTAIGVAIAVALVASQRAAKRVQEARADRAPNSVQTPAATESGARAVAPSGMGAITFDVHPAGDIWIDGRRVGSSPPLGRVPLAAGPHRVEIRGCGNPPQPFQRRVEVVGGKTQVIRFWCPD